MVHDSHGLHHAHTRKRIHVNHEKYPHPHKWKRFMDKAIYVVGVFGPLMTIPQLAKIWVYKDATGVSAISWISYLFCAFFWLAYGLLHKEKPIIITYLLWIILESCIVVGAILYG
jgi:uncharacterized protein with PQ loop repeat